MKTWSRTQRRIEELELCTYRNLNLKMQVSTLIRVLYVLNVIKKKKTISEFLEFIVTIYCIVLYNLFIVTIQL